VISRSEPRLITNGQVVERGASGGITLFGSLAALTGALLVGLFAVIFSGADFPAWPVGLAVLAVCGLAGSMVDSLLGASVQAIYTCPTCNKETERHPLHTCGTHTVLKRGWPWLNNDWVNLSCTLSGAALAVMAWTILPAMLPALNPFDLSSSSGGAMITFPISSSSFPEGELIPARYTCDGENRSPELAWKDLPTATRSIALLVEDPDAPGGVFTHWVLYNLPPSIRSLPEGQPRTATMPGNGTQGINDFRRAGYDGPCPPAGSTHRYYFKLMALDIEPSLPAGFNAGKLRKAVQGHILAEAQWVGRFGR
jgi:Raf kinase inhibitor-like YbhB/YbcL family protein